MIVHNINKIRFKDLSLIQQLVIRTAGEQYCDVFDIKESCWKSYSNLGFYNNSIYRHNADYISKQSKSNSSLARHIAKPNWNVPYPNAGDEFFETYAKLLKKRTESPMKKKETVLFNRPATIVMHADGSKTVTKVMDGEKFDPVVGYLHAFFLKESGLTRTQANKKLESIRDEWKSQEINKAMKEGK